MPKREERKETSRPELDAEYAVQSWDETSWHEGADGRTPTRATVRYRYSGDLDGESRSESVMCYRDAKWASFVGLEHFAGRLGDRTGSFVLQTNRIFEKGVATSTAHVVAGSGTDGLRGLRGEVRFEAGHMDRYPITFEYDFEDEQPRRFEEDELATKRRRHDEFSFRRPSR